VQWNVIGAAHNTLDTWRVITFDTAESHMDAQSDWMLFTHDVASNRGFRAQRFYLNLLPVLGFLHHSTDLDEPHKPVTSVFLISQHRKSYKPSKNGAICAWAYLLCAQRFYRSAVFDRTFVQTLIALCIADRSGTKVLCANFVEKSILQRAQRFCLQQ